MSNIDPTHPTWCPTWWGCVTWSSPRWTRRWWGCAPCSTPPRPPSPSRSPGTRSNGALINAFANGKGNGQWIWLYLKAECHYTEHTQPNQVYHLLWGHIEADSSEVHLAVVVHTGDDKEYTGTLRTACRRKTQIYNWVNVSVDKQNLFLISQVWRLRLSHTPAQPKHMEVNIWDLLYMTILICNASASKLALENWQLMVLGRTKLGHKYCHAVYKQYASRVLTVR